jgi:pyruvate-formate lyase-activating enzyme
MKICKRGYRYLQVINSDGDVTACSWTGDAKTGTLHALKVGNLLENSVEEIYQGEVMKKFFDSLLNKTYEYCPVQCCPYLANGTLDEFMVEYEGIPTYPKEISLSYERDCNYVCPCCRNEHYRKSENELDNIQKIQYEIDKYINKVDVLSANGYGEVFASKNIMKVLSEFDSDNKNVIISIETNGSLFNEVNWRKICNLGKYTLNVAVTVHSFDENGYQYLSGTKMSVNNILSNLRFLKSLREQGVINYLELASVVQERNFREMPEFTRRCIEEFGADKVRLRSYFPTGTKPPYIEWFFDPRNPAHPYYDEYCKVMNDPIFKHEKVLMWSGDELSKQREIPLVGEGVKSINDDNLKTFITCDEIPQKIEQKLKDEKEQGIIIYGSGILGEALVKEFQKTDIPVDCFLDSYDMRTKLRGINIVNPIANTSDNFKTIIITVPRGFEEISIMLRKNKYKGEIIEIHEIIN